MGDKTGHRDINGNWVDETPQAKLRNKLTPFWTLTSILSEERYDKNNPEIMGMVDNLVKRCEDLKKEIMDLINQTEK